MHSYYLLHLPGVKKLPKCANSLDTLIFDQYCYGDCSNDEDFEHVPYPICDWFQIGGRATGRLQASKGIKGCASFLMKPEDIPDGYDIVLIKDLTEPLKPEQWYGVLSASDGPICAEEFERTKNGEVIVHREKVDEYVKKINNGELDGLLVVVDMHD